MSIESVDKVLDEVRPILIADGGNVEVVSADDGVVRLRLQVWLPSPPTMQGCTHWLLLCHLSKDLLCKIT